MISITSMKFTQVIQLLHNSLTLELDIEFSEQEIFCMCDESLHRLWVQFQSNINAFRCKPQAEWVRISEEGFKILFGKYSNCMALNSAVCEFQYEVSLSCV